MAAAVPLGVKCCLLVLVCISLVGQWCRPLFPPWIFTLETRSASFNEVEAVTRKAWGPLAAMLSAVGKAGLSAGRRVADPWGAELEGRSARVPVPVLVPPFGPHEGDGDGDGDDQTTADYI